MKEERPMKWIVTIVLVLFTFLFSQDGLIISEIVDGTNTGGNPKYVEIYNAHATNSYSLSGLQIRRYANGSTDPANVDLDATATLAPGETWVVANGDFDPAWGGAFTTATPDQTNGNISGNGDDVYELYNTNTGKVIDVYGEVGVDGSGTPWEYTDSQVVRKSNINDGNDGNFDVSEWTIVPYDNNNATPGTHSVDQPLPISLASFAAIAGDGQVTLRWVTESEVDNVGFEVLRSMEKDGEYTVISSYVNNPDLKGQVNSNTRHVYRYVDGLVANGFTYWYKLVDVDLNGKRTYHGPVSAVPNVKGIQVVADGVELPEKFALHRNYPNPFNPETHLSFDIPALNSNTTEATLVVYNTLGQKVKVLYEGDITPGRYQVTLDGTNEAGQRVPSGVYFALFKTPYYQKSVKMMLLK